MTIKSALKSIVAATAMVSVAAHAQKPEFDPVEVEQYRAVIKQIKALKNIPGTGFNLVEGAGETFMISNNGRFVVRNVAVFDTWTGKVTRSATEADSFNKINFAQMKIRMEDLATFTFGKAGAKENVIFIDPRCPYCKAMVSQAAKLASTHRFRVVLSPLLGEESVEISKRLLCMKDKAAATKAIMTSTFDNLPAAGENCDTEPMARAIIMGRLLGNNAVPFTVTTTGVIHRGLVRDLAKAIQEDEAEEAKSAEQDKVARK